LNLRKNNPALSADASYRKVLAGDQKFIYAYVRQKGTSKILVILNLSDREQTITLNDNLLTGQLFNVFTNGKEPLSAKPWKMEAWGYAVFRY
jgi:glycosidase